MGRRELRVALVIDVTDRWRFWMEPDYVERLAQVVDAGRYDRVYAVGYGKDGKVPLALLERLTAARRRAWRSRGPGCGVDACVLSSISEGHLRRALVAAARRLCKENRV